jgi:membrane dipeptidase
MTEPLPVFDGHNDLLLRLWRAAPGDRDRLWLEGDGTGHLDLPRMQRGGFAGGLFAIYVPSPDGASPESYMSRPSYDLPLPSPLTAAEAAAPALEMAALLLRLERVSARALKLCRTADEIRTCLAAGPIAAVMHMEGAEAIGADLDALYLFYAAGLRSLGPVWSRPNLFGHGVPFRFPGDPDTGPGLTPAGRALVRACEDLRMVVDLSHLNAAGFDDVAALTSGPLVATHSNAHAVSPSTRNLTDRQLEMIRERDGMVGLNFATCFLRPDGRSSADTGWEPVLRHLDHLIDRLGEERVGFGSDFDGATVPAGIGDAAGLPALVAALRAHGYDEALLARLGHGNWLALLERVWGG